jgi:ankyrin repeat protein
MDRDSEPHPSLSEGAALMLAAERGATRSIRSWQQRGGDVNLPLAHAGSTMTPLQTAAHAGYDTAVRTLLECAADPDRVPPKGSGHVEYRPLILAARGGHSACLVALLEAGANPNGGDAFGQAALHYAAAFGHAECCMALLRYGADPTTRDVSGHRPDSLASTAGHTQLAGTEMRHRGH